jgi:tagatose 6-phosphate kinase
MPRFVVVTPNPAVDVTYMVDGFAVGETVRVQRVTRAPGGKGLNVARVLHLLGREVVAVQPLGGPAGEWIADALAREGISAETVTIRGVTRSTVAVANIDGIAHPTLLAEPGPSLDAEEWSRVVETVRRVIRSGDWLVIAGSFPPGAEVHDLTRMINVARVAGARTLVDTTGAFLTAAARAGADIVKANRDEVREATGATGAREAADILAAGGSAVMVSLGAEGALFWRPGVDVIAQPAIVGVHGNPTGAGDAATAGLLAALADGHEASSALAWAAVCGAAAVQEPTAGHLDVRSLAPLAARLPLPPALALSLHTPESSGDPHVAPRPH